MSNKLQTEPNANSVLPLPEKLAISPKIIFTDVDDTLTYDGQIPVETFAALQKLSDVGILVVPVTGASAGWCDCLIKTWPIKHIIGENGALSMTKDDSGLVSALYTKTPATVKSDIDKLLQYGQGLIQLYPAINYTQDQPFRVTDIAFDIGQTHTVDEVTIQAATNWLVSKGVQARRSSIHINAWLGNHSKSTGAMDWLHQHNISETDCLFIGDSPNDESMFKAFSLSIGVANIDRFLVNLEFRPTYTTARSGGYGFVDLANVLLRNLNV